MAKAIMVQGTMSHVGKSLLTAGLCRAFAQDGVRVAPFKSQNMALNSYVTWDGLEMGRAQVMQAEAAGIEPAVQMNPVLLKPTSDRGSQVIVEGEVVGVMPAKEYFRYRKTLQPIVRRNYEKLCARYDVIVIEGAGSPAELNLKEDDLVNMGVARMAKAPVLLVGDIDRGGVFAQLYGTLALLEEEERRLVKGLIVNKFRGDLSLFDAGVRILEEKCQVPVLGTLPYLPLHLEEEDGQRQELSSCKKDALFDIAVIRFPRISNFTDLDALGRAEEVNLRYVQSVRELGMPDMIVLPGTKNTMADLAWLRRTGLAKAVSEKAGRGTLLVGICGGFQMLGQRLEDPLHTEEGGTMEGLGLLPLATSFSGQKTRCRVSGRFLELEGPYRLLGGVTVSGYEIHMGHSFLAGEKPEEGKGVQQAVRLRDTRTGEEKIDGFCRENILGTYVHGLFDHPQTLRAMLQILAGHRGVSLPDRDRPDPRAYKESQYDLLAAALRENLQMDLIYRILEEGV